jgi:predicted peptidase
MIRSPGNKDTGVKGHLSTVALLVLLFAINTFAITGCNSGDETVAEADSGDAESAGENGESKSGLLPSMIREDPGGHRSLWESPDGSIVTYHVTVPSTLHEDDKMPLVLFLHPGTPNSGYVPYYGADFVNLLISPAMDMKDALIVAPDCNFGNFINEASIDQVMELVEKICEVYPVDRQRTAVVGYSMGGQGAWCFARAHPDFFRAAIVMASGTPDGFGNPRIEVPVLVLHSQADEVIAYNEVKTGVEAMKDSGNDVTFDTIADANHFQMNRYNAPLNSRMEWLRKAWEKPAN